MREQMEIPLLGARQKLKNTKKAKKDKLAVSL